MHRASHSAPSLLSPTEPARQSSVILPPDSSEQSYLLFSPTSPTAPSFSSHRAVSPSIPAPAAKPTRNQSFRSVASLNTRLRNRSAALAVLEGRTRRTARIGSFMSFGDDDDEEAEEQERTRSHESSQQ